MFARRPAARLTRQTGQTESRMEKPTGNNLTHEQIVQVS